MRQYYILYYVLHAWCWFNESQRIKVYLIIV